MASSRVMASSSQAGSDLGRQSSVYSLPMGDLHSSIGADQSKNLGSTNMEDILREIYGDMPAAGGGDGEGEKGMEGKTAEEVWKEISAGRSGGGCGGGGGGGGDMEMTLEDFLARTGAVREEDIRVPSSSMMGNPVVGLDNGVEIAGGVGRGGRGRKRPDLDPVDRAALQRQKRMIKNRESAARSRERKQAYTAELETLVTQLEEENALLLNYQEEQKRKRLKQLMENVVPVTLRRKPRRPLRRTSSMEL
ncbi:bZIP transcription factor 12-like [Typha latifolia]|uniref:bZIP transcription factor 12-like n=1 Tax=Typha latifolia TaxID=4733 RepID=UPI003C2D12CC